MDHRARDRHGGPREIEIKFEIDPCRVDELRGSLMLHAAPERTTRLVSTYFDSDDLTLHKSGFGWRIRRMGDHLIQTVKGQGSGAVGLHDRPEWELEVTEDQPDIDAMARTSLAERLDLGGLRGKLRPLFVTDIERTTWRVPWDSSVVEVACDRGRVAGGGRSADIAELELELIDGTLSDLYSLARDLASRSGARLAVASKSERGYELLACEPKGAVKATPLPITPEMRTDEVFKMVVRACIRDFRLNESDIETRRDLEAVHQARVALRRLRSALSIFAPLLQKKALGHLEAPLKSLFQALGRARNLDVYLGAANGGAAEHSASRERVQEITLQRERAYDEAIAKLASSRHRALMLEFSALAELEPWLGHRSRKAVARRSAREFASCALEAQWQHIDPIRSPVDRVRSRELHRLRTRVKTLRYSCEFFGAAFVKPKARRRYRRFIARLGDLQNALGSLNDLAIGRKLAKEGAAHESRRKHDHKRRAKNDLLAVAAADHAALSKIKPFW